MTELNHLTLNEFFLKIKDFELPTIQRGFVWKPYQIENLWDSLAKNFPIGSFVYEKNCEKYQILDGQQRLTAISLVQGKEFFSQKTAKNFRIFIDMYKAKDTSGKNKFIFRVITNSHPWGYQLNKNTTPLSSADKSDALKRYNITGNWFEKSLYEQDNEFPHFWPYDCYMPIPLDFFFNNVEDEKINAWINTFKIKDEEDSKITDTPKTKNLKDICKNDLYTLDEIRRFLEELREKPLFFQKLGEPDDREELFIRINAGGTPLSSEELNYSLLKSRFNNREAIERFEKNCANIIRPSKAMLIAFRLYQNKSGDDDYSLDIKTKNFEKLLDALSADKLEDFRIFMTEENPGSFITLLQKYKEIIRYSNKNTFGLPYPMFVKLGRQAPELVYMLLYRLFLGKDNECINNRKSRKKIIAGITLLYFFYYQSNKRDYAQVFSKIYPVLKLKDKISFNDFWGSLLKERADLLDDDNKIDFPDWKSKQEDINVVKNNRSVFEDRSFLLFAQRKMLYEKFENENELRSFYTLDDTNVPYDDDHILPQSMKRKIKNKNIKTLYETNGNHRFWPYSANRADHDILLFRKFNNPDGTPKEKDCEDSLWESEWTNLLLEGILSEKQFGEFDQEDFKDDKRKTILNRWNALKYWLDKKGEKEKIKNMDDSIEKQLKISLCNTKKIQKEILDIIVQRNKKIYFDWYNTLEIASFLYCEKCLEFIGETQPDEEGDDYYVLGKEDKYRLYIDQGGYLEEDAFLMEIHDNSKKIQSFTLLSTEHYQRLKDEIKAWLENEIKLSAEESYSLIRSFPTIKQKKE